MYCEKDFVGEMLYKGLWRSRDQQGDTSLVCYLNFELHSISDFLSLFLPFVLSPQQCLVL